MAATWPDRTRATLHVVHVVEDVMVRYGTEFGMASPDLQKELESGARRELEALITEDDLNSVSVVTAVQTALSCRQRHHRLCRRQGDRL